MANPFRQRPTVFVSYRRNPSTALAHLLHETLERRGLDVYVDSRDLDAGYFTPKLLNAIAKRDAFLCLLAESTLDSEWVCKEIEHAHNTQRLMIPVFQEGFVRPENPPDESVEGLLQSNGVKIFERSGGTIDAEVSFLADLILKSTPFRWNWRLLLVLIVLIGLLLFGISRLLDTGDGGGDNIPTPAALTELNSFHEEFGYPPLEENALLTQVAQNVLSVIGVPSATGIESATDLARSLAENAQVPGTVLGLAGRQQMLTFDAVKLALDREGGEGDVHRLYTRYGFAQSPDSGVWVLVMEIPQ
ncbi:MAG: TIR domain-containing protein [Anaerolineae bacterium]|nr:TIR domain-containing protein [Anaerolineae bacterium]